MGRQLGNIGGQHNGKRMCKDEMDMGVGMMEAMWSLQGCGTERVTGHRGGGTVCANCELTKQFSAG